MVMLERISSGGEPQDPGDSTGTWWWLRGSRHVSWSPSTWRCSHHSGHLRGSGWLRVLKCCLEVKIPWLPSHVEAWRFSQESAAAGSLGPLGLILLFGGAVGGGAMENAVSQVSQRYGVVPGAGRERMSDHDIP